VDGNGSVSGGAKGTAQWTLVPTVDAAPTEPVVYYVGGRFQYTLNGVAVDIPLSPVPITVNPTARLTLDYFHQRDVYSDDPFTDLVEPSIPFNLAVMVRNNGAGAARNFRITSAQPEIVENEKGLLIDFKIIATEVQGQNLTPTLTANFGTIEPHSVGVARWLMTSTLQGLFINYSATFEHLDGQGNPRLSLIDDVFIHEMNRLVQVNGQHAFLANDVPDIRDLPDTLWLSNGSSNQVEVVTNGVAGIPSPGNLQVQLTAALPGGWAYLRVPDPADGQYRLVSVVRSDSTPINVNNAWVTDRTFYGLGKKPKRENILHLLDRDSTGSYTLTYAPVEAADTVAPVSSVAALPAQSQSAFTLNWAGQDEGGGSGIAGYDIYFSADGAPFQRWLTATPGTSSLFQGAYGKTYAFYSVATDRAGNREPVPAVPQAQTTVALSNQPPVLNPITNQVIPEGQPFQLTVTATDPEGTPITYQLGVGAPPGLVLNGTSGQLTWITGEGNGPSTNPVTFIALDSGIPQMSATQTFLITVLESNTPPTLAAIENVTLPETVLLTFTNVASDIDLPVQQLTWSLGAGAPLGASIHPTSGVFSWQPSETQGGTTNPISIIVTDNGPPSLSATQTFIVVVLDTLPDFRVGLGTTVVATGTGGGLPLTLQSGIDLTNIQLRLSVSGDRLTNLNLSGLATEVSAANIIPLGSNQFDVRFDSKAGALLQGNLTLAQIGFNTVSNEHSAVARLRANAVVGVRTSTGASVNGSAGVGRVFIVGEEPILDAVDSTNRQMTLTLYGQPGERYALERSPTMNGGGSWSFDRVVAAAGLQTTLDPTAMDQAMEFYRAYRVPASRLTIRIVGGQVVIEWPLECVGCELWRSSSVAGNAVWTRVGVSPTQVNGVYRVTLPLTPLPRYYRLVLPIP
jgi:hypothetical protein